MVEYSEEKWVEIYQKALMELEHAKMRVASEMPGLRSWRVLKS